MIPSKECHTCKKCQQGFKSLPTHMNHVWSQHCILLSDSTFKIKYSLQRETQWLPRVCLLLPSLGRDEETQEEGAQGQEGLLL